MKIRNHQREIKLSDLARSPKVKAFFDRGLEGPQAVLPKPTPRNPAPAALERELA